MTRTCRRCIYYLCAYNVGISSTKINTGDILDIIINIIVEHVSSRNLYKSETLNREKSKGKINLSFSFMKLCFYSSFPK